MLFISAMLYSPHGYAPMIFAYSNPTPYLFDLRCTAKSRNFAHVRAHRRPVHGSLALSVSQVHRLVMIFKISFLLRPNS